MKTKLVIGLLVGLTLVFANGIVAQEKTAEKPETEKLKAEKSEAEKPEVEKLNLNLATLDELKVLPGITPEIAQMIIEKRPYQKLEDLVNVKDVTQAMLDQIKDKVEVRKLNLNAATVYQLQTLPDVTQEIAEEMVKKCPYKSVDELLLISGFGEKRLEHLRAFIDVQPAEKCGGGDKGWKTRGRSFTEGGNKSEPGSNP